ncbi:hypothetical protein [Maribellus sp. YY47]|uniref:hypothetical protein n=1 Tax=Maribellus sp. YY47 TaxID=2929486 RepID=UPI0020017627|nr:hypothetical protein [Maribellus sp. YY47]MCK3683471.1 hypothetical protein [Maribellus sp. YY47]
MTKLPFKKLLTFIMAICATAFFGLNANAQNRWELAPDGKITWKISDKLPHSDHIEMSGDSISVILNYTVIADRSFKLERKLVWPMLRTIPNNTHASLIRWVNDDCLSKVLVNGKALQNIETTSLAHGGLMEVKSSSDQVELVRTLFPSTEHPAYFEHYVLTNKSNDRLALEIPDYTIITSTDPERGVEGSYKILTEVEGGGFYALKPGESVEWNMRIAAKPETGSFASQSVSVEKQSREKLVASWWNNLVLETPDEVLNRAFAFAKIRASESIYKTKGGYMHGPGGGAYYAAIWANDQAEYVGPFFPFLGYEKGNDSSLNAYLHFARFMNPEYKPIPSSIIAEGIDIWNGAGDRGDAAMIAYGASRFALTLGDRETAEKLWPLIEWCLEYNKRKLNDGGVVSSDADELEGRFPVGDANLCTSSLYYDALLSAAKLGKDLGKDAAQLKTYQNEAKTLKSNIESFFGRKVEGFNTYRYYDGNDVLRAWICIPLTVGIYDRAEGTIDALFSPRLWTDDGLATEAGDKTFWDRSTLYALRGVLQAGETEKAMEFLEYYSQRRLLGEHVPYPVEAYPEGGQRHLSAESGLYCRIFTEGLFGIRPTGLSTFELTPQLPEGWDSMALRKIHAFGEVMDIEVQRKGAGIQVKIIASDKAISKNCKNGKTIQINL